MLFVANLCQAIQATASAHALPADPASMPDSGERMQSPVMGGPWPVPTADECLSNGTKKIEACVVPQGKLLFV